jgi:hypothetical protein
LRRNFLVILTCIVVASTTVSAQSRRRSPARAKARASSVATEKNAAEIKLGREQVAAQIKTLTHFVYLLGGIAKGIEAVDLAVRNKEAPPAAIEQNNRNKLRIRDSLKSLREGLDKLESDFRFSTALQNYNPYIAGIARLGESAENQAAANRFDESGRTLLKGIAQLADALAAMR